MRKLLFLLLLFSPPVFAQLPPINGVAGPTTSTQLRSVITDEIGTGSLVFGTLTPTGGTAARSLLAVLADSISVRNFATCDGSTDDAVGLQAGLTYATANNKTLDFGNYSCVASNDLVATSATVSIRANAGGNIRFTGTTSGSAGFNFSLRGYSAGVVDKVYIDGLTIIAGAAHHADDAAIKAIWQTRVANSERMLVINNVVVKSATFASTNGFNRDLWIDAAFNGVVDNWFAYGNQNFTGTSIYVNQSVNITFVRPDVSWKSVAAQFTTGTAGAQPQNEGMYLVSPVLYNVNKCLLIDGTSSSSGALNMIDFDWSGGHCAAAQGTNPFPVDITLMAQSSIRNGNFTNIASTNPVMELSSVNSTIVDGNWLELNIAGPLQVGISLNSASQRNRVVNNFLSNFATALSMDATTVAHWHSGNQFFANTTNISDLGTGNSDGGSIIINSGGTTTTKNTMLAASVSMAPPIMTTGGTYAAGSVCFTDANFGCIIRPRIAGATFAFAVRNTGDTAYLITATDAGVVAIPGTLDVTGALTAASFNGRTLTTGTGVFTQGAGKTFNVANTLTLTATDGSTLAIGTGGTLGTAAYQNTGTSGANIPFLNGVNTFSGATTFSAAITYGGVGLSNAVTGTGNMVLSASATLTGTTGAADITATGTVRANTAFSANGAAGLSATVTVRDAAGTGTCTLIYTLGLKTGGSC